MFEFLSSSKPLIWQHHPILYLCILFLSSILSLFLIVHFVSLTFFLRSLTPSTLNWTAFVELVIMAPLCLVCTQLLLCSLLKAQNRLQNGHLRTYIALKIICCSGLLLPLASCLKFGFGRVIYPSHNHALLLERLSFFQTQPKFAVLQDTTLIVQIFCVSIVTL